MNSLVRGISVVSSPALTSQTEEVLEINQRSCLLHLLGIFLPIIQHLQETD